MNTITTKLVSDKMKHELRTKNHVVYADVSADLGGDDSAPSPHDLLAMSLAACTSMTIKVYAKRKEWPVKDLEVVVDIVKEPTKTTLIRQIKLSDSLTDEQKNKLLDIANHCPIHKVLQGQIEISTKLF